MQKLFFWRTDLGSNVLALNTPRGGNKRCFVVSTAEAGSNGTNYGRRNFEKNKIIAIVIILKKGMLAM